ncbi:MAG: tetratricopeptide repeat protein [Candidatus Cloacimonadota bacterium]|nr:tetratricopeptide repeat protein [Candidatus Cloacimonadota bacterium]
MSKKKISIVVFIFILSVCSLFGQELSDRDIQVIEYNAGMAYNNGVEKYQGGDYQAAIDSFLVSLEDYKKIDTEANPKTERIHELQKNLSVLYYTTKQYPKAVEYYTIRSEYDQDNRKIPLTLSKIYLKMGKPDSTLAILENYDEGHDEYLIKKKIGGIYEENGNLQKAIEYYLGAFELNNSKVDILEKVALFYNQIGQTDKAIIVYNDFIATNPPDYLLRKVYKNLGIFYNKTGNKSEAVNALEKSVAIKPNKDLFFNIGQISYDLGNYDKAKIYLLKVQKINPDHPETHYYLGKVYRAEGNYSAAMKEFKAIENHSQYGKFAQEEIKFIESKQ